MATIEDRTQATQDVRVSRQGGKPIYSRHGDHRAISRVRSIVLHQSTFSRMGLDSRPEDDFDHTIAHFVVRQNGVIHRLRTYDALLNNSRGGTSVSVEFEGNFANTRGRVWHEASHGRHSLTPAQAFAGRDLVLLIRKEIPDQISYIFGHMQFSNLPGRANCPGPHVWYNVGYWATRFLGMQSAIRGARPIPREWEDSRFDVLNGNPY